MDAFGVLFVLGGLAFSALMSPLVAAGFLVAYYLLSIETYLATYAIGRFKISWGPFGGTELRIVLAVVNALVFVQPRVFVGGSSWLVFDVLGVGATAALGVLASSPGFGNPGAGPAEGWAPPLRRPPSHGRRTGRRPSRSSRRGALGCCRGPAFQPAFLIRGLFSPPGPPRGASTASGCRPAPGPRPRTS